MTHTTSWPAIVSQYVDIRNDRYLDCYSIQQAYKKRFMWLRRPSSYCLHPYLATLQAGKHVLCEKPVYAFDTLYSDVLAKGTEGSFMVGFHRRFDDEYIRAVDAVRGTRLHIWIVICWLVRCILLTSW